MTNIPKSKGNQATKHGQLIKFNFTNLFLEESYTKYVEKLFPDPFSNWAYLWINTVKFYIFCLYCLASWRLLKLIETATLAFTSNRVFLKNKKRSRTSLPASSSAWFLNYDCNYLSCILLPVQIAMSACLYFVRYWAICVL